MVDMEEKERKKEDGFSIPGKMKCLFLLSRDSTKTPPCCVVDTCESVPIVGSGWLKGDMLMKCKSICTDSQNTEGAFLKVKTSPTISDYFLKKLACDSGAENVFKAGFRGSW